MLEIINLSGSSGDIHVDVGGAAALAGDSVAGLLEVIRGTLDGGSGAVKVDRLGEDELCGLLAWH